MQVLDAARKRQDKVEEFPVRFILNGDRVVADRSRVFYFMTLEPRVE